MNNNPFAGAAYLLRGLRILFKPGIRRYVVWPLIINTGLFSALIVFGASRFNRMMEWILPERLGWLEWLLWPLFAVGAALAVFFGFIMVANLVGAPFNDRLSEAVEVHLQGRPPGTEGGLRGMVLEAADSVLSEIRKLVYWAGWSVPFLVLFVVPFVNVVAPLAWMGFTAWMLAVEYLDYPMARHGLPPARQRELLRAHRLMSLGFGGAVMILIMIPVLNFLAMPAAVAGATAMWVERFSKNYSTV